MTELFFGDWLVRVNQKNADFSQQFTISGSDSSDGTYPGIPGTVVSVSGQEWTLNAEWNNNVDSGWQPSRVQRVTTYGLQEGLRITLGIDDDWLTLADGDYDDMILNCESLDPIINPPPSANPYDFTITEDMLTEGESPDDR